MGPAGMEICLVSGIGCSETPFLCLLVPDCAVLLLLFSAAFSTVNHAIITHCLECGAVVNSTVLA